MKYRLNLITINNYKKREEIIIIKSIENVNCLNIDYVVCIVIGM